MGFEHVDVGDGLMTVMVTVLTVGAVAVEHDENRAVGGLRSAQLPTPELRTHGVGGDAEEGGGLLDGHPTVDYVVM